MSKPSIPVWQRTATTDPPSLPAEQEPKPENAAEDSTKPVAEEPASQEVAEKDTKGTDLLEQASRFLEDPNIRNAPRGKKAVFLQAKGVSPEDIETLLGRTIQDETSSDMEEAGARAWSTVSGICFSCALNSRAYAHHPRKPLEMTVLGTTQTAVCAAITTSRDTTHCHISRISCTNGEAAAADYDQTSGEHSLHHRRVDGDSVRLVQVHHCTNGA